MELFQPIDESIHDFVNFNSFSKYATQGRAKNATPVGIGTFKALGDAVKRGDKRAIAAKHGITRGLKSGMSRHSMFSRKESGFDKDDTDMLSKYASTSKHFKEDSEYFDESIHDVVNMNSSGSGIYNGELRPFYSGMNSKIKNSNSEEEKQFNRNHAKKMVKNAMQGNFSKMGLRRSDLTMFADGRKFPQDGQKFANEATEGISLSTKKLISAGGHNSSDLNAVKPNAEYCDQYDKHFIGDGEDPETSRYNVPAILAARTAGGAPFDQTLSNGINRASADVFHLKKLRDDEGMNG